MTESEMKFRDTTIRNFFDKEDRLKSIPGQKKKKTSIVRAFNQQIKSRKSVYGKRNEYIHKTILR